MGWRLPTIQELSSLVDPSVGPPGPTLPVGHPFQNLIAGGYFSASTHPQFPTWVLVVDFYNGVVINGTKDGKGFVWCVRGGQGVDPQ